MTYRIKISYERDIPSLIDEDGTVLSYTVVNVVEYVSGDLETIAKRYQEIKAEHHGALMVCS